MKLLSLNAWGAHQGQIFFDYIREQSVSIDIFCFQEIYNSPSADAPAESHGSRMHLFSELQQLLNGFQGYYAEVSRNHDTAGPVGYPSSEGLAIFLRKNLQIASHQTHLLKGRLDDAVDETFDSIPVGLQELRLALPEGELAIFNFHGIPMPGHKLDTPERLEQSRQLLSLTGGGKAATILCGDFNLLPETQSVKMLEQNFTNLISKYQIQNTRNETSWKAYANVPGYVKQYFADFTFVSPHLKVINFEVPYNEVSDHLPMILEFGV